MTPNPHAYLRRVRGTIRSAELISFVHHLLGHSSGRVILFGDGLNTHRSKKTRAALRGHRERLRVYRLPAYAPELNPDEGVWGWRKGYALAGQCPPDLERLEHSIRLAHRRLRRRSQVIRSFIQRFPLSFYPLSIYSRRPL